MDISNLKAALDTHAIVAITDRRGRITYANDQFCLISKYSREELLGQDHRIVNSGTHSREFMQDIWRTISAGRTWHGEICNRAKDGTLYWVETTIHPVLDEHGRPEQYIALRTDITRRKLAEAELTAARDRAESLAIEAQRASRAKTEFLASMSHEIRTPMNGVLGFAELLLDTPLDDEQRLYVSTIRGSGKTLLAIIDDILDLSKVEAGRLTVEKQIVALRELLDEVMHLMSLKARDKGLTMRVEIASDVPGEVCGDAVRIRQVFTNLVGNAVKFTERGGVDVRVSRAGAAVRIEVADTGIGVAADKVDRLFRHFSQADSSTTRRFGGTGLGLVISKQLVELMGGSIGARTREGEGSTFWFTLPIARAA